MRKNWKGAAAVFAALAVMALVLSACSSGSTPASSSGSGSTGAAPTAEKGPIVVGSKIDGEGALLGQIILQTLRANGFTVVDKTRTGATKVVRQALVDGQIDVYPEYTANGPLVFHSDVKVDPAVLQSASKTYQLAKSEDASIGIDWLQPAPANNTWAVAVPAAFATKNQLASLADLAAYINKGGTFKIVGSQEFFTSAVAFPAFEKAYGFKIKPSQEIALATGDTAVTEKAAAQGSQGANAAMAYGTDGTISALNLVVLTDPKGAQPIYQPAPIFRDSVLKKYPEIETVLDPVFATLDLSTLQSLNKSVAVDGKDTKTVAADWLKANGFVK
jgi:osmoprotectant transport system substrate-binding protein